MRKYIYPKGLILGYFLESMANNSVEYSLKKGKRKKLWYHAIAFIVSLFNFR